MDLTQTSISQRRGREAARPRAGLIGNPIANRIADLVVLELIGCTHPGVPR